MSWPTFLININAYVDIVRHLSVIFTNFRRRWLSPPAPSDMLSLSFANLWIRNSIKSITPTAYMEYLTLDFLECSDPYLAFMLPRSLLTAQYSVIKLVLTLFFFWSTSSLTFFLNSSLFTPLAFWGIFGPLKVLIPFPHLEPESPNRYACAFPVLQCLFLSWLYFSILWMICCLGLLGFWTAWGTLPSLLFVCDFLAAFEFSTQI